MRQGNDFGTQYRSAIYTFSQEQMEAALRSKEEYQKVTLGGVWNCFACERRSKMSPISTKSRLVLCVVSVLLLELLIPILNLHRICFKVQLLWNGIFICLSFCNYAERKIVTCAETVLISPRDFFLCGWSRAKVCHLKAVEALSGPHTLMGVAKISAPRFLQRWGKVLINIWAW